MGNIVAGTTFQSSQDQLRGLHNFETDVFMFAMFDVAQDVDKRLVDTLADVTTMNVTGHPSAGLALTITIIDDPEPNGGGPSIPGRSPVLDFDDIEIAQTSFGSVNPDESAAGAIVYNTSQSDKIVWVITFGTPVVVDNGRLLITFPDAVTFPATAIVRTVT